MNVGEIGGGNVRIHCDFPGGNAEVAGIWGNAVWIRPALRDTAGKWFYWAFCVEGAEGETVAFHLDEPWLGYFGPAKSTDLKNWAWCGKGVMSEDRKTFIYRFLPGETRVYFAHHMLYPLDRVEKLARRLHIPVRELTVSNGGNSVPLLTFGEGENVILLLARHHACESTGSYVLEGVLEALAGGLPAGYKVIAVPFMDMDGVLKGDQGKNRIPHDHNRDYTDTPLYAEVRAVLDMIRQKPPKFLFDFHAPWHAGGANDRVFLVRNLLNPTGQDAFSRLLAKECKGLPLPYEGTFDLLPFEKWNRMTPSAAAHHVSLYPGVELSLTLETAYFGTEEQQVTQENLLQLGSRFGKALCRYIIKKI